MTQRHGTHRGQINPDKPWESLRYRAEVTFSVT